MLWWLSKMGENARVQMCIKELMWDLETRDGLKRATVLAIAQILKQKLLPDSGFWMNILDRPLGYTRSDLMKFYNSLETIRNQGSMQLSTTQKNARRMGAELPQFAVEHAKSTARGLEVWMCTLGAGIVPGRRDDVRAIWLYLSESVGYVEEALLDLRQVEQQTMSVTGIEGAAMFSEIDIGDLTDQCRVTPTML